MSILLIVVVALAVLLVVAAQRPDHFRVERKLVIQADAQRVFGLINRFDQWALWSPWEKLDPAMQRQHSGAAEGVGACYNWTGNKKVGTGRMEILASTAPNHLKIKLDFLKPFEAHNTAEFSLKPVEGGTEVVWAMYGPSPFISKLMGLFMNMDNMIGKDFEAGLANLKAQAEA